MAIAIYKSIVMQRSLNSIFFSTLPLATIGYLLPLSVQAQITPDGTTSTTVNQNDNNFVIESGDRITSERKVFYGYQQSTCRIRK